MVVGNGPHVSSVEKAVAILETLDSSRRGLNISEMSRKLGIPKSSAHVIVVTLERLGYVTRDPVTRHYSLGLKVCSLGQHMMQNFPLPEIALPHMKWLAEKTKLTVHLAILEKNRAIYVQKVVGPGPIRFDSFVGKRTNLHCTAVGKVLLAYSPDLFCQEFMSKTPFTRHTKTTITSATVLRKVIQKVRETGYALDDQEEELEVRCIAAPVFNHSGESLAALSVAGTVGQIYLESVEALALLVKQAAARIYR